MSIAYMPLAILASALLWAEMPLHAILCAGMGISLIELLKAAWKAGKTQKREGLK